MISVLLVSLVFAQTQPTSSSATYRNLFKISPSQFTRNTFQMDFEHFISPITSFQINAGMIYKDADYSRLWGVQVEGQFKFHVFTQINPRDSHRLYFAPYIQSQEIQSENQSYTGTLTSTENFSTISTGVLFGWSFSFANRINLDIYTGGGIKKSFNSKSSYYAGIWDYGYSGITPRLGIDVGFWF